MTASLKLIDSIETTITKATNQIDKLKKQYPESKTRSNDLEKIEKALEKQKTNLAQIKDDIGSEAHDKKGDKSPARDKKASSLKKPAPHKKESHHKEGSHVAKVTIKKKAAKKASHHR
jgi:hypothetical protein